MEITLQVYEIREINDTHSHVGFRQLITVGEEEQIAGHVSVIMPHAEVPAYRTRLRLAEVAA